MKEWLKQAVYRSVRRFKDLSGWERERGAAPARPAEGAAPAGALVPVRDEPPSFEGVVCQMATEAQIESPAYRGWCARLGQERAFHRKQWEHCFILQALEERGHLREGARALGFGVGREPIAAVLAARGVEVTATDLPADAAEVAGWDATRQHAAGLEGLRQDGICPFETLARKVRFRPVDMRKIPADLAGFDLIWSSCAFEHLGSLDAGLDFVRQTAALLAPGGVAVHTTELNLSSNSLTMTGGDTVVFRRRDLEQLARELVERGFRMTLNFHPGTGPMDRAVQEPPYQGHGHLKIRFDRFVVTSFGLVIEANPYRDLDF